MSRNPSRLFEPVKVPVGKAGFIWCHGTVAFVLPPRHGCLSWKSRFYLMSRNLWISNIATPHSFGVGKAGFIWCHGTGILPGIPVPGICWKSRFYLMSRNKSLTFFIDSHWLEKPVLFDVTEHRNNTNTNWSSNVGKAGFIWCHGTSILLNLTLSESVGKAGFIWCHGTYTSHLPIPPLPVGKAGFIWCHGT